MDQIIKQLEKVLNGEKDHIFFEGDCGEILENFPQEIIDCVITSPPYWKMREYEVKKELREKIIGNENNPEDYINKITTIFKKIKDILKPKGSVWLNIGDKYLNKNLMGMPWRVTLALKEDGWILRNDIIWDQRKGTQSVKDRCRDVYEHIFHFVKNKKYYFNDNEIRILPEKIPYMREHKITSATGVSGIKYKKQILNNTILSKSQKDNALKELEKALDEMKAGIVVDFRMTILGMQRTYHSNNTKVSGRAKELEQKGYYILKSKSKGYLPSDIWRIVPEDKWRKDIHYAVFPEELLRIPIKATCPNNGIILDPFCGIGSTIIAALQMEKRGIGIDISKTYIDIAKNKINEELDQQRKLF